MAENLPGAVADGAEVDVDPALLAAGHVRASLGSGVLTVTLDRPEARNAQTPATWRALAALGDALTDAVRVVVVRGEGASFSAGLDRAMFTPEGLRHLAAEVGSSQIVMGTDYPFPWTKTAVDHILETPGFSDAERTAMLGGTASQLLGIKA